MDNTIYYIYGLFALESPHEIRYIGYSINCEERYKEHIRDVKREKVKTYKKKFDIETALIVADLEQAIDIPVGRWIDIRLQELPQPEFVPPVSNTPASFQPTGISQAVSEMMNGTEQ